MIQPPEGEISGDCTGGFVKQTGATDLLFPKRLFVRALVHLVRAVRRVDLAGLLAGATLVVQGLVLEKRVFMGARLLTFPFIKVDA